MTLLDGETEDGVVQFGFRSGSKVRYDLVIVDGSSWLQCCSVESRGEENNVAAISTDLVGVVTAPHVLVDDDRKYYFSKEISMVNAYDMCIPDTSRVPVDFQPTVGAYDE